MAVGRLPSSATQHRWPAPRAGSSSFLLWSKNDLPLLAGRQADFLGLGRDRLAAYPFYSAAQGELELRTGRQSAAHEHFRHALSLARNPSERRFFEQRLQASAG